jgi:hypothetical protein
MHSIKRNAAAGARGVPESDQLGGMVDQENSPRAGHRSRLDTNRIERKIDATSCSCIPRRVSYRKYLLLQRADVVHAWAAAFPRHDLVTMRLRRPYNTAELYRECESWKRAARVYHQGREAQAPKNIEHPQYLRLRPLLEDDVSLDRAWNELNASRARPTPQTTVEAIMLCVCECGIAALKEPANIERLSRCDKAAREQIDKRIEKLIFDKGSSA